MSPSPRFPPLDRSKIVRERKPALPAGAFEEDPAGELHQMIRAIGLPEPELEYRLDRRAGCCGHDERHHIPYRMSLTEVIFPVCYICADQGTPAEREKSGHEFKIHRSARRWRFDFAWPDRKVALEVEGGTWSDGRHVQGSGYEEDCRKYSEAAIRGWKVVRVTSGMVSSGEALELLERAIGGAA